MADYIIGVDIGTSGTRAVLCDERGKILGIAATTHRTAFPQPGWAEQNPMDIYQSVVRVVDEVAKISDVSLRSIRLIVLSSVFHSLILLDTNDTPLTRCIVWLDTRSTDDARTVFETKPHLYLNTGCPANASYPLSKLAWFKRSEPEIFARVGRIVSIKDFIIHKLTGEWIVDICVAGGSGLLDIQTLGWNEEALDYLEVKRTCLSPIVPVTTALGISHDACADLGLSSDTRVVVGAADGMLASIGSGASAEGILAVMMGTSGACRVITHEPKLDDPSYQRTWSYPLSADIWATGTSVNNCGSTHQWIIDTMFSDECTVGDNIPGGRHAILDSYILSSPPGSRGLRFLPWLLNERGPYWDSEVAGAFIGLRHEHRKSDIYRAVVEGIIYLISALVSSVEEVAGSATEIRATGGFTNSPSWMNILASVLDREVLIPETRETVAFGACLLGLVAMGVIPSIEATRGMVEIRSAYQPMEECIEVYRCAKKEFMRHYEQLRSL